MVTYYNPSQSSPTSFSVANPDVYLSTKIEIGLEDNAIVLGESVVLYGFLSYFTTGGVQTALESKSVDIWVKAPGATAPVKVGSKTSGSGSTMGEFTFSYTPTVVGTYEIYATYAGTAPVGAYYGLAASEAGISVSI
jgi:hypothetical protein